MHHRRPETQAPPAALAAVSRALCHNRAPPHRFPAFDSIGGAGHTRCGQSQIGTDLWPPVPIARWREVIIAIWQFQLPI